MPKLILHSDDFGLHKAINHAILEAAEKGVLTSASLMVNGMAAKEAIAGALRHPSLGVGIHLNILRGTPLSDPAEIPGLVSKNGRFLNSASQLLARSALGKISPHHVYLEYRRQVLYMMDHGLRPTHFDGEKHTHLLLPEAVQAVRQLSSEFGIRKVRLINETGTTRMLAGIPMKGSRMQRLKLAILEHRSEAARKTWSELRWPDYFFGVRISGQIAFPDTLDVLRAMFALQAPGTIEWMFHPGYPFDARQPGFRCEFGDFFLDESRENELRFLLSDEAVQIIREHRGQLISYREF